MSRYFFHLRDRAGVLLHVEGAEHPNAEAAATEAVRHARGMIVEDVRHRGEELVGDRIEITDAAGAIVATVNFADSLSIQWGDATA